MKFLPYVLKHLRRNWIRTGSTVMAMSVCIFLFCTLQTFVRAVTWSLQSANATRLVSRHAVSLVFNLPIAYQVRIADVPGVKTISRLNWFGGQRKANDFRDFFPSLAVDAEPYLQMYPEIILSPDQKRAFMDDMRGCIVGKRTADRFGWKIGDTVQLESFIPPYRIGKPFEFVIQGIFTSDDVKYPGTDLTLMFFHYKYLYEATRQRAGVGNYVIEIDDPSKAGAIAKTIDALFENSDAQTKTETESAFRASFISQAGNLALLLNGIALAVMFTILLVTANTMSMAIRERRTEIAVLKTLGFPSRLVMMLVLGEAIVLGALGGIVGIFLGRGMIKALPGLPFIGDAVRGFPDLTLTPATAATALAIALALGFLAGLAPAFSAYKSKITDMLRTV